jgi:hypothetical protein
MPSYSSDPTIVAKLQTQQALQAFAQQKQPHVQDAAVASSTEKLEAVGKSVVDVPKAKAKVTAWLVLNDISMSLPCTGVIRFRAGQVIDDPRISNAIVAAGGKLKSIVG